MDQLLEQARTVYEGEIDFEGQRVCDLLSTVLLSIVGIVSFIAGFATQNIYNTLYVGLGGTALTFLITIPPWPFYNKNPAAFRRAKTGSGATHGVQIEVDGKQVG